MKKIKSESPFRITFDNQAQLRIAELQAQLNADRDLLKREIARYSVLIVDLLEQQKVLMAHNAELEADLDSETEMLNRVREELAKLRPHMNDSNYRWHV